MTRYVWRKDMTRGRACLGRQNPTVLRSPRLGGDKQGPVVGSLNQEDKK